MNILDATVRKIDKEKCFTSVAVTLGKAEVTTKVAKEPDNNHKGIK